LSVGLGNFPVPWQQVIELLHWMFGDIGEDMREPGLRIDIVHFGGDDQAIHDSGALSAAVTACEEPGFPAQGDAAQGAFSRVVGQTDPSVAQEAREDVPSLEHIRHGFGDIVVPGQGSALFFHPGMQFVDQRRAVALSRGFAFIGAQAVESALDLEQGVDALDGFQADRRHDGIVLPLRLFARVACDIGKHEELSARMAPAPGFEDRSRHAGSIVELVVAAIGIRLKDPAEAREMRLRMMSAAIAGIIKHRSGRRRAIERPIVAHIHPDPARIGFATGQHRNRRIVGMQPLGGEHMRLQPIEQRHQRGCARADLIRQSRQAQRHAFTLIALRLPVGPELTI
jgi:hypothetical protein